MKTHQKSLIELISEFIGNPKSGCEVGVFKASTSLALHRAFPKCELSLVDSWKSWDENSSYFKHHKSMGRLSKEDWEAVYEEAKSRINQIEIGKATVYRMTSLEASKLHPDGSLDFCFIDADHTYEHVKQDIQIWLPKTRRLICGHDYKGVSDRRGRGWGVSKAVHEIFGKENIIQRPGRIWAYIIDRQSGICF